MFTSGGTRALFSGARSFIVIGAFAAYAMVLYLAAQRWQIPHISERAWAFLLLALLFELFAKVMFGALFRLGLQSVGRSLSWRSAIRAAFTGSAVARLVPVGGALTPATMAMTVRDEQDDAAGAAVRVSLLTYAGLLVMTGGGLLWMATEGPHPVLFAGMLVLGGVLALVGVVLLLGATWLDRVVARLPTRVSDYLGPSAGGGRISLPEATFVGLRVLTEAAVLWAALAAFGIVLTPSEVLVAHGLSMLIGGVPGLPGGLGVVEGGIIGMLSAFGFSTGSVVAPVLVYRIIDYWIPAGLGLGAFATVARSTADQPDEEDLRLSV